MMLEFDFSAASTHLRYNLLIGLVAPRPIALVTSLDATGRINAAPFSAFNYVGTDPALVVLGIGSRPDSPDAATGLPVPKDSVQNIRRGGEFVINVVSEEIAEAMNVCAIDFPPGFGELAQAKLTTAPCKRVAAPRIAESPACLECREVATLEIGRSRVVIGEVLYVQVREEFIDPAGPYVRADQMHAIGRMNGLGNYVRTRDAFFQIPRIPYKDWQSR
jgi:flavin reductase (DIM6/NTAB) family NADH-FMN oxidoreductase RutF